MDRYYIRVALSASRWEDFERKTASDGWSGWVEVSPAEWLEVERRAGFISQHPGLPATAGFSSRDLEGKMEQVKE